MMNEITTMTNNVTIFENPARSGEVRDLEITPEILIAAVKNTVELCKEAVELEE